jgi:hypothetical protein
VYLNLLLLLFFVTASPTADRPDGVAAYSCGNRRATDLANLAEIGEAYGRRSVAIIQAGLRQDVSALAKMVAPSAKFIYYQGDVGMGPRSVGAEAAAEFARKIGARRFQFSVAPGGPFSENPCDPITSEVRVIGEDPASAKVLTFKYDRGMLVDVTGSAVTLVNGRFAPR